MKTNLLIIVLLALVLVPQSGCKVRKKYSEQLRINESLKRTTDSLSKRYLDSMAVIKNLRTTEKDLRRQLEKKSTEILSEDMDLERKTVKEPVKVDGKTYKYAFAGNWMLDTSGIKEGKLIYFDLDNDDMKATAYYENGQMKVEMQTKDKVIDVAVEELRLTKGSKSNKSTSESALQTEKTITKDSLQSVTAIAKAEEVKKKEVVDSSKTTKQDIDGSKTTTAFPGWGWVVVGVAVVLLLVFGVKFNWVSKIINWIKK